jgi:hypothetical protein
VLTVPVTPTMGGRRVQEVAQHVALDSSASHPQTDSKTTIFPQGSHQTYSMTLLYAMFLLC